MKYTKLEIDDDVYYFDGSKLFDDKFVMVEEKVAVPIMQRIYQDLDYKSMEKEELFTKIKDVKDANCLNIAKEMCLWGLEKYGSDIYFVRQVLPIMTSIYRLLGKPQEAILFAKKYMNSSRYLSDALFTSIAAAYCDLDDFVRARRFANVAYAKLKDAKREITDELKLVYKRIEYNTTVF